MKPIQRLHLFIKFLDVNISKFEREIGATEKSISAAIKRGTSIKDTSIILVKDKYPYLDLNWLLYGAGEMIIKDIPVTAQKDNLFDMNNLVALCEQMKEDIKELKKECV